MAPVEGSIFRTLRILLVLPFLSLSCVSSPENLPARPGRQNWKNILSLEAYGSTEEQVGLENCSRWVNNGHYYYLFFLLTYSFFLYCVWLVTLLSIVAHATEETKELVVVSFPTSCVLFRLLSSDYLNYAIDNNSKNQY